MLWNVRKLVDPYLASWAALVGPVAPEGHYFVSGVERSPSPRLSLLRSSPSWWMNRLYRRRRRYRAGRSLIRAPHFLSRNSRS